jgi:hypothetical protein
VTLLWNHLSDLDVTLKLQWRYLTFLIIRHTCHFSLDVTVTKQWYHVNRQMPFLAAKSAWCQSGITDASINLFKCHIQSIFLLNNLVTKKFNHLARHYYYCRWRHFSISHRDVTVITDTSLNFLTMRHPCHLTWYHGDKAMMSLKWTAPILPHFCIHVTVTPLMRHVYIAQLFLNKHQCQTMMSFNSTQQLLPYKSF